MKGLEKFEPESYYHIVNHVVGNENLFRSDDNYRYFLKRYSYYMSSVCGTLAYCLMPNHIHILIKTHNEEVLKKHPKYKLDFHKLIMQQFSNLLNSYAKAYNKRYQRRGALWIDFTKRFHVNSDSYLTSVINYIHQNPVKHGFSQRAEDWKYSSYQSIRSNKPTALSKEEVIEWFGNIDECVAFHERNTAELLDAWEY